MLDFLGQDQLLKEKKEKQKKLGKVAPLVIKRGNFMEFMPPLFLTLLIFYSIIIIVKKSEKIFFKQVKYRQSDIHNAIKQHFFLEKKVNKKQTQLSSRLDKNSMNVLILDDKAYWVTNNIFYNANFINGEIKTETIEPINTSNLSRKDLDKMLFILDKLGDEKKNDSGSTR
jgi:hypothetical protein